MKRLYLLSIVLLLISSSVVHAMDEGKAESAAVEAKYAAQSKALFRALFNVSNARTTAAEVTAILDAVPEVDRAAFLKMQNSLGQTALFAAKSEAITAAILNAVPEEDKAELVMMKNWLGRTVLFYAKTAAQVTVLLGAVPEANRAAIVKMQDDKGYTAIFNTKSGVVAAILSAIPEADRAAYVNIKNKEGDTVLFNLTRTLTREEDRNAIIQLLLIPGIDINAKNIHSRTAREHNAIIFDDCARAANEIITERNAAKRKASIDALVLQGMAREVANMVAQYDEQPLIEIPKKEKVYELGGRAENPGPAYSCKHQENLFNFGDWVIVKRSSGAYTYGQVKKPGRYPLIRVDGGTKPWGSWPEIYRIPPEEAPEKAAAGE